MNPKLIFFFHLVEDMINDVDIDGDGRIDYDEFVASLKAERQNAFVSASEESD